MIDHLNIAWALLEDLQDALGWSMASLRKCIRHLDQMEYIAGEPGSFMLNPEIVHGGPHHFIDIDIEKFWQLREGTLLPMRRPTTSEEQRIQEFVVEIQRLVQALGPVHENDPPEGD